MASRDSRSMLATLELRERVNELSRASEVGDLQRSSEALDPSLESQIAAGATEIVIKSQTGLRCS